MTKQIKSYARTVVEREEPPSEPPKLVAEPLWVRRGILIGAIADRFANASEQILTPDEIEAGAGVNFTSEKLLAFVRERIWDHAHPDEVRELQELEWGSAAERASEQARAALGTKGQSEAEHQATWVAYLKANPLVTINAGPALSPEEIRDVLEARAKSAASKDQKKTDLYERFPDRFLQGFRTVAEYDLAHPGEPILKHKCFYPKFPHERYQP